MYWKVLISVVVLVTFTTAVQECDLPPSLWCSTPETAKRCKVYDQCKEFHTVKKKAAPVNLTLYHESLCPDCINFITGSLWKAYTTVPTIFTLTMVPYGNAKEKKEPFTEKYRFTCQHGKEECIGNLIESCAIHFLKNETKSLLFSHCVAMVEKTKYSQNVTKVSEKCAKEQNIDFDQINSCANGPLGNQLEHQMALMTDALNPPHRYVPWVTINGVHTEEIEKKAENDLVKLICDTYQFEIRADTSDSGKTLADTCAYMCTYLKLLKAHHKLQIIDDLKGPKPSACQEMQPKRGCQR